MILTFQKNIPYDPVKDIDFTSAKGKKRKIDDALTDSTVSTSKKARMFHTVSPPTDVALKIFIKL